MNNITLSEQQQKDHTKGWINGLIGVILFSGSMPATKAAVLTLTPSFVTATRASIAGLLAIVALILFKEKIPSKKHLSSLIIISLGVVVGFPLLSALALEYMTSAHSLVFLGLLPLSTAIFGVLRGKEKPKPLFWLFSILGAMLIVGFAFTQGVSISPIGDGLMLLAIILCGLGYAEGAKLSSSIGGWQVISWALVIALPFMLPLMFFLFPTSIKTVEPISWIGLAYISIFSMFVGFIFWYRGLALGGIAAVGQLQLLQPFLGLFLAASILHEQVSVWMIGTTLGVILCVAGSRKFGR